MTNCLKQQIMRTSIEYTCSTAVCIYDLYSCCKDALENGHKSTLDFLLSAQKERSLNVCLSAFHFFPSHDEKKCMKAILFIGLIDSLD
jgi:hypothetical protein